MKNRAVFLFASAAVIGFASPAYAASTITFDPAPFSFVSTTTVFTEAGFTLTYTPVKSGFAVVDAPANCSPACSFSGSNAFYSFNTGSLTITATNGSLFSLIGFQAAQVFKNINYGLGITVTGVDAMGIISGSAKRAKGAANTFVTFSPAGFDNLLSLTFSGSGTYPMTQFALDNIVLNASPAPEPATWAMMVVGFGLVGGILRSRRKTTARFA